MKLKFIVTAVFAMALAACSSTQISQVNADLAKAPSPAAIAAQVCPSIQAVLPILAVPGALAPEAEADLAIATPIINTVCAAGAAVQVADLHTLSANALPILLKVAQTLPAKDQQTATLAIAITQAALAPVLAQAAGVAPVAPVSAPAK